MAFYMAVERCRENNNELYGFEIKLVYLCCHKVLWYGYSGTNENIEKKNKHSVAGAVLLLPVVRVCGILRLPEFFCHVTAARGLKFISVLKY